MPSTKAAPKKVKPTPKKRPKRHMKRVEAKLRKLRRSSRGRGARKLRDLLLLKKPSISSPKIMKKPAKSCTPSSDEEARDAVSFLRDEAGGDEEVLKHKVKQQREAYPDEDEVPKYVQQAREMYRASRGARSYGADADATQIIAEAFSPMLITKAPA